MLTAKVFQSGNSQAVRIPKEVHTEQTEFNIAKFGNCYLLYPVNDPWAPFRETAGTFPADFLEDRDQPMISELEEREDL